MAAFKLTIVSPHGKAFEGECESLYAPGREGDFGVLAGHAPMLAMLRRGVSKVVLGGTTVYFVTGDGVCEVTANGVSMLVDAAHKTASAEEARAELARHLEAAGGKS